MARTALRIGLLISFLLPMDGRTEIFRAASSARRRARPSAATAHAPESSPTKVALSDCSAGSAASSSRHSRRKSVDGSPSAAATSTAATARRKRWSLRTPRRNTARKCLGSSERTASTSVAAKRSPAGAELALFSPQPPLPPQNRSVAPQSSGKSAMDGPSTPAVQPHSGATPPAAVPQSAGQTTKQRWHRRQWRRRRAGQAADMMGGPKDWTVEGVA
mmetsp:Transcript_175110/g.556166  ORF Transcript_175110/g.556166 Transcript_175110/m.556166 type:complete len:218 (+) Transcript_175110:1149-1802(+)